MQKISEAVLETLQIGDEIYVYDVVQYPDGIYYDWVVKTVTDELITNENERRDNIKMQQINYAIELANQQFNNLSIQDSNISQENQMNQWSQTFYEQMNG